MTNKIDEKFKEVIISKIPSARLGEPEDVANAVIFLASPQSDYINGEKHCMLMEVCIWLDNLGN